LYLFSKSSEYFEDDNILSAVIIALAKLSAPPICA
jgi:hypothetical protein